MNKIGNYIYDNLNLLPEDLQGWNGNDGIFEALILEINPNIIIEVGTWKGQSTITMGKTIKKHNLSSTIYAVDTWLGAIEFWDNMADSPERNLMLINGYPSVYYQFISNVVHNNLQDIIIPFPNTSLTCARYFRNKNVRADLIYIDASHEYEDVIDDLEAYFPLLSDKGIIFGDDYGWSGVKQAVDEFVVKNQLTLGGNSNHWVLKK
jgi:predicted O-methyltransferase YrrM